eukprot:Sspe_Gene.112964::Locus_96834_Transcript_1_1_Confidence_1.000_Length_1872::g.112964::m.112964
MGQHVSQPADTSCNASVVSGTSTRIPWKPDHLSPTCEGCGREWLFFSRRRHHCRRCGGLFCDECSMERRRLPSHREPQRVCMRCAWDVDEPRPSQAPLTVPTDALQIIPRDMQDRIVGALAAPCHPSAVFDTWRDLTSSAARRSLGGVIERLQSELAKGGDVLDELSSGLTFPASTHPLSILAFLSSQAKVNACDLSPVEELLLLLLCSDASRTNTLLGHQNGSGRNVTLAQHLYDALADPAPQKWVRTLALLFRLARKVYEGPPPKQQFLFFGMRGSAGTLKPGLEVSCLRPSLCLADRRAAEEWLRETPGATLFCLRAPPAALCIPHTECYLIPPMRVKLSGVRLVDNLGLIVDSVCQSIPYDIPTVPLDTATARLQLIRSMHQFQTHQLSAAWLWAGATVINELKAHERSARAAIIAQAAAAQLRIDTKLKEATDRLACTPILEPVDGLCSFSGSVVRALLDSPSGSPPLSTGRTTCGEGQASVPTIPRPLPLHPGVHGVPLPLRLPSATLSEAQPISGVRRRSRDRSHPHRCSSSLTPAPGSGFVRTHQS